MHAFGETLFLFLHRGGIRHASAARHASQTLHRIDYSVKGPCTANLLHIFLVIKVFVEQQVGEAAEAELPFVYVSVDALRSVPRAKQINSQIAT